MAGRKATEWTPEQIAMLGTVPDRVLAEEMGCSTMVVFWNRRVRGIAPCRLWASRRPRQVKSTKTPYWTPKRVALLGTAIDKKIAKKLGIAHSSVASERNKRGILAFGPQHTIAGSMARLERMRPTLETMDNAEAGEHYGISRERARQIRKKLGMPPSPRGRGNIADNIGQKTVLGLEILDVVGDEVKLRCPCGREFLYHKYGYTQRKTCGECTIYERRGEVGKEHHRLTIRKIYLVKGEAVCDCDCSCGGKWTGLITNVLTGATKSCGCRLAEYQAQVAREGIGGRHGRKKKATE